MPRQRQPESQSKRPKSRAEESASQISKTTGVSTKAPETSGDLKDPSLSRRRPASHVATSPEPSSTTGEEEPADMDLQNMSRKSQWLILAVGSGACAAFNGVFAKLYVVYLTPLLCFLGFSTTTELTTTIAQGIANGIGFGSGGGEKVVEVVVRVMFFILNLIFNGIMWTLFTKALARGTSTTQVSIINTSANFMITAFLGFIIFSESLPPLWWLGAALLVAGNVIIGRREEADPDKDADDVARAPGGEGPYADVDEELLTRESVELDEASEAERKKKQEEEDILHLDLDEEAAH